MKTLFLICATTFALVIPTIADDQEKTMEEKTRQELVILESNLAKREKRLAGIAEDMIDLDNSIEGTITTILDLLKKKQDSKDSGTFVTRTKQDAIKALQTSIQRYETTRRELRSKIDQPGTKIDQETLKADIAVFDERIEKRVNQIIEITQTLATHEDYNKYIVSSGSRWRGSSWRKSDDWMQNRKLSTRTGQERKSIVAALQESIERLKAEKRNLETKIAAEKNEARKELFAEDLSIVKEKLDNRQSQLVEVLEPSRDVAGKGAKVGSREGRMVIDVLKDTAEGLERDINALFARYHELIAERRAIAITKEAIAARLP